MIVVVVMSSSINSTSSTMVMKGMIHGVIVVIEVFMVAWWGWGREGVQSASGTPSDGH